MGRFFVYILFSKKLNKFYTGVTTLAIEERLENHLLKKYSKLNFTQKSEDWEMFHFLECADFSQARKIELHIKKMKSKVFIENLRKYPELCFKLLEKYKSI